MLFGYPFICLFVIPSSSSPLEHHMIASLTDSDEHDMFLPIEATIIVSIDLSGQPPISFFSPSETARLFLLCWTDSFKPLAYVVLHDVHQHQFPG